MATVSIRKACKSFGPVSVIRSVDLDIADGEFAVIVGPSGCGKSTLLRAVCGLESLTEGSVLIDGVDVTHLQPASRGAAMVFQSYALYPHMSVAENMGFALRMLGEARAERDRKVREAAAVLKLDQLLGRLPRELSGGQRQRVAIGRAIVRNPKVFLFDEPLSNLDADLRVQMRLELAELHRRLGTTMIYVTHDQVEAMTLADRIVVMKDGRVEQVGTADDVYSRPRNKFVASFIGSPRINFFAASVEATTSGRPVIRLTAVPDQTFKMPECATVLPAGQDITVGVRPEALSLEPAEQGQVIEFIENIGSHRLAYLAMKSEGRNVVAQLHADATHRVGDRVKLQFDPSKAVIL
jgi:ABC-type sugar transport system ATPase subunit